MINVSQCSGNKDLEKFTQTIVKAQVAAKNVPDCVEELAGCIFVQNVEAPALAVLTPVLVRGLNERTEATKRRCCVIVDNMCKLIDDAREGSPLMAEVRGLVYKATEAIADPEAREVSEKCYLAINKLVEAGAFTEQDFKTFAEKHGLSLGGLDEAQIDFCNQAAFQLVKAKKPKQAGEAFAVFDLDSTKCEKLVDEMANVGAAEEVEFIDDDAESPDLYKGSFSLAYGTVTLLRETKLHLKKNKFY